MKVPRSLALTALLACLDWRASVALARQPTAERDAAAAAATSSNQLGFDLLSVQAAQANGQANLAVSPLAVSWALGMTYSGAAGDTARQIASAGHFPTDETQTHARFASLSQALSPAAEGPYTFRHASRLWGATGHDYAPDFLATIRHQYSAELFLLDFQRDAAQATNEMNAWIAQQTANRINRLVTPELIDRNTQLLMTTAVYFRGTWLRPFSPDGTANEPFFLADGTTAQVPMMRQIGAFRTIESEGARLLLLPYRGERLSMAVVLPPEKQSLREWQASLTVGFVEKMLASAEPKVVELALPRFEMTVACSLKDDLSRLGVVSLFGPEANLSRVTGKSNLYLQDITHQTFVKVDEAGTEAAAGTAVVAGKSVPVAEIQFRADRPFLFFVLDEPTGAILFLGHVMRPGRPL